MIKINVEEDERSISANGSSKSIGSKDMNQPNRFEKLKTNTRSNV